MQMSHDLPEHPMFKSIRPSKITYDFNGIAILVSKPGSMYSVVQEPVGNLGSFLQVNGDRHRFRTEDGSRHFAAHWVDSQVRFEAGDEQEARDVVQALSEAIYAGKRREILYRDLVLAQTGSVLKTGFRHQGQILDIKNSSATVSVSQVQWSISVFIRDENIHLHTKPEYGPFKDVPTSVLTYDGQIFPGLFMMHPGLFKICFCFPRDEVHVRMLLTVLGKMLIDDENGVQSAQDTEVEED